MTTVQWNKFTEFIKSNYGSVDNPGRLGYYAIYDNDKLRLRKVFDGYTIRYVFNNKTFCGKHIFKSEHYDSPDRNEWLNYCKSRALKLAFNNLIKEDT